MLDRSSYFSMIRGLGGIIPPSRGISPQCESCAQRTFFIGLLLDGGSHGKASERRRTGRAASNRAGSADVGDQRIDAPVAVAGADRDGESDLAGGRAGSREVDG